jgi:hypothetical protein
VRTKFVGMLLYSRLAALDLSDNIHGKVVQGHVGLGPTFGKHERTSEFIV